MLRYSVVPFDTLVEERQVKIDSQALFVTISPNPNVNVECVMKNKTGKTRNVKRPYWSLKQDLQYEYCMKCFKEDYCEFLSQDTKLVGISELNKRGDVHLHMIINDPCIKNDVNLQCFRRDILNSFRTQQNIIKGKAGKAKDWMNNIVFVNTSKDDIVQYFMKNQEDMLPRFKNYYL